MTNLSPAAQTVWTAAWEECPVECGNIVGTRRKQIAAALRALSNDWRVDTELIDGVEYIRTSTLDKIADELENARD